jgi:hypothetical protein
MEIHVMTYSNVIQLVLTKDDVIWYIPVEDCFMLHTITIDEYNKLTPEQKEQYYENAGEHPDLYKIKKVFR